jgi:hypothetical protein
MSEQRKQIFICWSGERSKLLADIMQTWLKKVVPGLDVFTSMQIKKGARWFDVVSQKLAGSNAGLVCLTPEGMHSSWIHFEAGNLAHAIFQAGQEQDGQLIRRIFTFLFQVSPGKLEGPLAAYQSTQANQADTERMLLDIMDALQISFPADNWENHFRKYWADFETKLGRIPPLSIEHSAILPHLRSLFHLKTFEEPFDECTNQNWGDRFRGAFERLVALQQRRQEVERLCPAYQQYLYNDLCSILDGYAMDLHSLVIPLPHLNLCPNGKLDFPENILKLVEHRRKRILQLILHLTNPGGKPVLEESIQYARMTTLAERKATLIHPFGSKITKELVEPVKKTRDSRFEESKGLSGQPVGFDRLVYCLYREQLARKANKDSAAQDVLSLVISADRELEKLQARDDAGGLVPLYYALRALLAAYPESLEDEEVDNRLQDLM